MKDLKSITRQIGSKRDLEVNLPMYSSRMFDLYNKFSNIKFSMNYYTLSEVFEENTQGEYEKDIFDRINNIIKHGIIEDDGSKREEYITEIDSVRKDITKRMEVVTSFVDKFQIYEYVLNRIEFRYDDSEFSSEYYENRFTNDIMHYIIKDKETVNAKISEIIAQLPIRITKNKFYERINEAFSLYKEGSRSSFDEFVYMIRTVSMLYEPEGFNENYPYLSDILSDLQSTDFRDLSYENYNQLKDKLTIAVKEISGISDVYVMLQELVNDIYIILLSSQYAFGDESKINSLSEAVKCVNSYVLGEIEELDISYVAGLFSDIEGMQEDIYSKISSNDFVIDEYKENDTVKALSLDDNFKKLSKISKLSSNSIFIKLEDVPSDGDIKDGYIQKTYEDLVTEFDVLFDKVPVIIRRAVMSNVMANMPNFFKNIDELQSYINVSLSQCNDVAERRACVSLIKQIIETP